MCSRKHCLGAVGFLAAWLLAVSMTSHQESPPGRAVAQELPPAKATTRSDDPERNDALAREWLARRISVELIDIPLSDALAYLADTLQTQFYADWKKIEQAGVTPDAPISINLQHVSGAMALELTLDQAGAEQLAYVVRDGIVIVSTAEELDGAATTRVYNCRDLLFKAMSASGAASPGFPGGALGSMGGRAFGGESPRTWRRGGAANPVAGQNPSGEAAASTFPPVTTPAAHQLVAIFISSIAPSSWQTHGGRGTIAEYDGLVVVNHSARVHAQVEQVLKMLREAAAADEPTVVAPKVDHSPPK